MKASISLITLSLLLGACSNELPNCKSKETINLIEKIINDQKNIVGQFVDLKDIEEEAYNSKRQLRTCFGTVVTMKITEDISYSIKWKNNKKRNYFYIEIISVE